MATKELVSAAWWGSFLVLFVVLAIVLSLIGRGQTPVSIPAKPPFDTPLIEFSIDGGGTWQTLTQDEVVRVQTSPILIQQTSLGQAFAVNVRRDLAHPRFKGSINFDEAKEAVEVAGKGAVVIVIRGSGYAKIILEPEKPKP